MWLHILHHPQLYSSHAQVILDMLDKLDVNMAAGELQYGNVLRQHNDRGDKGSHTDCTTAMAHLDVLCQHRLVSLLELMSPKAASTQFQCSDHSALGTISTLYLNAYS